MSILATLAKIPPEFLPAIERVIVAILSAPSPSDAARAAQEAAQISVLDLAMSKVPAKR